MQNRSTTRQLLEAATGGLRVPRLAKAGGVVIAAGFLLDLLAHTVLHAVDQLIGAFPLEEHFAHLVVVVGMALALAGIVADGMRSQRRQVRQEVSGNRAVR